MRRVRQSSSGQSPATFTRMSAAVSLSAALHVVLIYGITLPAAPGLGGRVMAIHARLISAQPAESLQSANPPARLGEMELPPSAPNVLPQPASIAAAEAEVLPTEVTTPIDPNPVVPAGNEAAIAIVPDLVHYPARDLDIYPQALSPITPIYPETAREAQVAGAVTLLVLIDAGGTVVGTSVLDAAPDGIFENAARQALANTAFYPAQKDGRPVRSRILIKVEFEPGLTDVAK